MADIDIEDLLLIAIPANHETDIEVLTEKINTSKQRTLIFMSEGADIKLSDIIKRVNRKVRTVVVGHQVQSNGLMIEIDEIIYKEWIKKLTYFIESMPTESYALVTTGYPNMAIRKEELSYFAKRNPREGQIAKMNYNLEELIRIYMA